VYSAASYPCTVMRTQAVVLITGCSMGGLGAALCVSG
jgi:hypothetical protein